MILLQPIVVEPTELNDEREHHKKGSKRKSRRKSSSANSSKGEGSSKFSLDKSPSLDEINKDEPVEEESNNKGNVSGNHVSETKDDEQYNMLGKKGKTCKVIGNG